AATWAWLLVLILLPIVGFIIYLFLGRKISKEKIFDIQTQEDIGTPTLIDAQKKLLEEDEFFDENEPYRERVSEMGNMFLESSNAILAQWNKVELITDGKEKFDRLLEDIQAAEHHVHLTYYIYRNDKIGQKILHALEDKAAQGVEVLFIYDPLGSRELGPNFFKKLRQNGGKAEPFFGSRMQLVNFRINYRNHRKIVIIDGKVGYTGGFN